ncbi:hypothetical protein GCM10022284_54130 [Streptomyces hundungensis]
MVIRTTCVRTNDRVCALPRGRAVAPRPGQQGCTPTAGVWHTYAPSCLMRTAERSHLCVSSHARAFAYGTMAR